MSAILIIEDDDQVRGVLQRMLEGAGYEVMTAANGRDAMRLQQKTPARVVVTDIVMPEQEGLQTITELRRDHPDTKIIAISGGGGIGSDQYLRLAGRLGAQEVFPKPFSHKDLLAAVERLGGGPVRDPEAHGGGTGRSWGAA